LGWQFRCTLPIGEITTESVAAVETMDLGGARDFSGRGTIASQARQEGWGGPVGVGRKLLASRSGKVGWPVDRR
jgi:hypothetical protein